MIILLAVVALIIVNALKDSPWGTFTIAHDHSHRAAHGPLPALSAAGEGAGRLRARLRSGDAGDLWRAVGFAVIARWRRCSPLPARRWPSRSSFTDLPRRRLPVWLLLAPRDYLSTFVKLGTIAMLALGIILVHPDACRCPRSRASSTAPGRFLPAIFFPSLHHHCVRRYLRLSLADLQSAPRPR